MLLDNCLSKDVKTSVLQVLDVERTVFEQPKPETLEISFCGGISTVANFQGKESNITMTELVMGVTFP